LSKWLTQSRFLSALLSDDQEWRLLLIKPLQMGQPLIYTGQWFREWSSAPVICTVYHFRNFHQSFGKQRSLGIFLQIRLVFKAFFRIISYTSKVGIALWLIFVVFFIRYFDYRFWSLKFWKLRVHHLESRVSVQTLRMFSHLVFNVLAIYDF